MKIGRTIPPAAAPLEAIDLWHGALGLGAGAGRRRDLEDGLRAHFGVRYAALVSSGSAALAVILRALSALAPGRDEVVIPAYTCFSVPSAVCRERLAVVPCDIDPQTLDFDHRLLGAALSRRTLCVVPTHLFGLPADVDRVRESCREAGAFVVEDAAQAMGVRHRGRLLGTAGDVGFFSLGRGKNLSCGAGGVVLTDSKAIADAVAREVDRLPEPGIVAGTRHWFEALLLSVFIHPALYWLPAGLPFLRLGETRFDPGFPVERLSGTRAGMIRRWRTRLAAANAARVDNARRLLAVLRPGTSEASTTPYLRLPVLAGSRSVRDKIARRGKGAGVGVMYPSPVGDIPEIGGRLAGKQFPGARLVSERLLTLPTHPLLTGRDLRSLEALLREPDGNGARLAGPAPDESLSPVVR